MIVLILYINLLNIFLIKKSVFHEYVAIKTSYYAGKVK